MGNNEGGSATPPPFEARKHRLHPAPPVISLANSSPASTHPETGGVLVSNHRSKDRVRLQHRSSSQRSQLPTSRSVDGLSIGVFDDRVASSRAGPSHSGATLDDGSGTEEEWLQDVVEKTTGLNVDNR